MSDRLIIDPNELYRLYDYRNVEEYYRFDFLSNFNSIEFDIFYDILNSLNNKELSNLNNYIFKQWSLTHLNLTFKEISPLKRKEELLQRNYSKSKNITHDKFNNVLSKLIQDDEILSLYIMNQMLKFLYPCSI